MDIAVFRSYLQPSPTLRWHPWAPLLALVAALAFMFAFGVKVGSHAAQRIGSDPWFSQAFLAKIRIADQQEGGIRGVMWDATVIDNAVQQRVRSRENPPKRLETLRDKVERFVVFGRQFPESGPEIDRGVKELAEWRLASLAGSAPAWRVTAAYCDSPFAPYPPVDLADLWSAQADAYSKFLGRKVTGAQLAPAVPGGHCVGRANQ